MISVIADLCLHCSRSKTRAVKMTRKAKMFEAFAKLMKVEQDHVFLFNPDLETTEAIDEPYAQLYEAYKETEIGCANCVKGECSALSIIENLIVDMSNQFSQIVQEAAEAEEDAAQANGDVVKEVRSNLIQCSELERRRRKKKLQSRFGGQ
jgi:hypothetical protein